MSITLILLVAAIYMAIAVDQAFKGQPAMAVMWFSYATANIGLACNTK